MKNIIHFLLFGMSILILPSCKENYFDPILTGSVQGQVLNAESLSPMEGVQIKITPAQNSEMTDSEGNFQLADLPVGSYTLEARRSGYARELISMEIKDMQVLKLDILLVQEQSNNEAPLSPKNPSPADQSQINATSLTLSWEAIDNNESDSLSFTVFLFAEGENTNIPLIENSNQRSVAVANLQYGSTYFWQVLVDDGIAAPVYGPLWRFTTPSFPDFRFHYVRQVDHKLQLFAADESGNSLQLSDGNSNHWRPRLSPNREQIAYISNQNLDPQLFLMNQDGSGVQPISSIPITSTDQQSLSFCWTTNGEELLYPSNDRLYAIRADGTGIRSLAVAPPGQVFTSVDWTPHGQQMVVRTTGTNGYDSEIYLVQMDGSLELLVAQQAGKTGNPVFSIDGKDILYTQDVSGYEEPSGRQLNGHVFLLDIASGEQKDLSTEKTAGTNDLDPQFSPNGAQVLFTNTDNDGISVKHILRMDLHGENRELLFEDAEMGGWQ